MKNMKKKLSLLLLLMCSLFNGVASKTNFYPSNLFDKMEEGDKVAILMVHFGTSHDDTRAKTIGAINAAIKAKYPDIEQREAWTSRLVIRILEERGETMENPAQALERLKQEGYTHIIIQSSNIIEGIEMEALRREVLAVKDDFKDIRVGNPILYTIRDYEVVADLFRSKQPAKSALVLVGHGTYTPATAQYAMFDYVLRNKGYAGIHIGTVEGLPDYDSMLARLKAERVKNVLLMPFMVVAGEHAKMDIKGDWYSRLSEEGYNVTMLLEGMGEFAEIQALVLEHVEFAIHNQMYDIIEKKALYAGGQEKL